MIFIKANIIKLQLKFIYKYKVFLNPYSFNLLLYSPIAIIILLNHYIYTLIS